MLCDRLSTVGLVAKKHALIFVTITLFIDTVGFGLIMPVLPEFLEELTGRSLSENSAVAGYLVVSFALLQFLFAPLIGNLSDRFGRKPVLLVPCLPWVSITSFVVLRRPCGCSSSAEF